MVALRSLWVVSKYHFLFSNTFIIEVDGRPRPHAPPPIWIGPWATCAVSRTKIPKIWYLPSSLFTYSFCCCELCQRVDLISSGSRRRRLLALGCKSLCTAKLFGSFRSLVQTGASVFDIANLNWITHNRPRFAAFDFCHFVECLFDHTVLKFFEVRVCFGWISNFEFYNKLTAVSINNAW